MCTPVMANPPMQGRVSFGDVENEELTLTSLGSRDAFAVALDLRGTVAMDTFKCCWTLLPCHPRDTCVDCNQPDGSAYWARAVLAGVAEQLLEDVAVTPQGTHVVVAGSAMGSTEVRYASSVETIETADDSQDIIAAMLAMSGEHH